MKQFWSDRSRGQDRLLNSLGLPPEPQKEADAVREVLVSLMHVVQVDSIDTAGISTPKESNGKKSD